MPFHIINSGIKNEREEITEKILHRSRTGFKSETEESAKRNSRHRNSIKSCGCDSVINKPYRPLGSMESVLNLKVEKRNKSHRSNVSSKPTEGTAKIQSKLALPEDTRNDDTPADSNNFNVGRIDESENLSTKIYSLRKNQPVSHGYHSLGYKEILTNIKWGDEKIKGMRAGGSFFRFVKRKEVMDGIQWASNNANVTLRKNLKDLQRNRTNSLLVAPDAMFSAPVPVRNPSKAKNRRKLESKEGSRPTAQQASKKKGGQLEQELNRLEDRFSIRTRKPKPPSFRKENPKNDSNQRQGGRQRFTSFMVESKNQESKKLFGNPTEEVKDVINNQDKVRPEKAQVPETQSVQSVQQSNRRNKGGQTEGPRFSRPSQIKSKKSQKNIPSYVLHVAKRPSSVEKINLTADLNNNAKKNRTVPAQREPTVKKTLKNNVRSATSENHVKRLNFKARAQVQKNSSEKAKGRIFKKSEEFLLAKTKLKEQLDFSIEHQNFIRPETYRRKYVAFLHTLNRRDNMDSDDDSDDEGYAFDSRRDIETMRKRANELSNIQEVHNLKQSFWFDALLRKALTEAANSIESEITMPEKRFLAALRQTITEGWKLDEKLFYQILLYAIEKNDHKSLALQRLISVVRDDVLFLDIIKYKSFLEVNKLHVPQSLIEAIEAQERRNRQKQFATQLTGGLRAATFAMKWKRKVTEKQASLKLHLKKNKQKG